MKVHRLRAAQHGDRGGAGSTRTSQHHLPQHFNEEKGTHLVSVADVHYEPFGLYPGKTKSLDALADGATVAVPNDATNEARALLLLQDAGLITLKDDAGINATVNDIVSNPKNLQLKEVEAATVPNIVADVDIACINGNYAIPGFETTDALATGVRHLARRRWKLMQNVLVVKDGSRILIKSRLL